MATNINEINNFSDLISQVGIEIPMIQRDYVQGRIHDTKELEDRNDDQAKELIKKFTDEKEKRDTFISKLITAIRNPEESSLQLTFLYGTIEQTTGTSTHHSQSFIPLDGQQRLTTMFLLSWTLFHKLNAQEQTVTVQHNKFTNFLKGLQSFKYKTRPSSGAFCSSIFSEKLTPITGVNKISQQLTKQSWFGDDWLLDPSVQAMLQTLDQMDETLSSYSNDDINQMLLNLIEGKGITFDILDMKNYQLTDGLYIKMNARGKQLTKFENWKSEFIDFLGKTHQNEIYDNVPEYLITTVFNNTKPTLKEYFEYSIEHQWTDLFWPFCEEDIENHTRILKASENPSKNDIDCYPIIDDYFMNCFYAIHQLFFFIDNQTDEPKLFQDTVTQRENTFKSTEHVKELFAYLDILKEFNDSNIYKDIFFVESGNQYTHKTDLIRLFDGKEINLFTRCAKAQDFTNVVQIILFGMLRYAKIFGNTVTPEFKSFIRQIRNIVEGESYLRKADLSMTNTLKICQIHKINKDIDNLIKQAEKGNVLNISNEHAEIDDLDFVCGNLKTPFLPSLNKPSTDIQLPLLLEVFKSWDKLDEYDKISLFIGYDYFGVYVLTCSHGNTYFIGKNERWKSIFMHDEHIGKPLFEIMQDYKKQKEVGKCGEDALKQLISDKKVSSRKEFNFKYYALNYQSFLYSHAKGYDSKIYFSIKGKLDELNIYSIIFSGKPILAYYTNPIVFATKTALYKNNSGKEKLFIYYSARCGDLANIHIYKEKLWNENGPICSFYHISGQHGEGGWEYVNHTTNEKQYAPDNADEDRIFAGVKFIQSIFPNNDFDDKGQ